MNIISICLILFCLFIGAIERSEKHMESILTLIKACSFLVGEVWIKNKQEIKFIWEPLIYFLFHVYSLHTFLLWYSKQQHVGCPNDSFLEGRANHLKQIGGKDSSDSCQTDVGGCCYGQRSQPVPVGLGSWWHLKQPCYWVKVRQLSIFTTHGSTQLC